MLLTVNEAATLMACTERKVYRWVEAAEIPFRRIRDQVRFDRSDLLDWAMSRCLPISLEAIDAKLLDARRPDLADALRAGGVHDDVVAKGRESLIQAIVEHTPMPSSLDPELVMAVMLARERTLWTAIGDGIAIPCVRHPLVAPGAPASVSVCYLHRPVAFETPDGNPIDVIFQILSPTVGEHLRVLAHLSRALLEPGFRAALERHASTEDLAMAAHQVQNIDCTDATGSSPSR